MFCGKRLFFPVFVYVHGCMFVCLCTEYDDVDVVFAMSLLNSAHNPGRACASSQSRVSSLPSASSSSCCNVFGFMRFLRVSAYDGKFTVAVDSATQNPPTQPQPSAIPRILHESCLCYARAVSVNFCSRTFFFSFVVFRLEPTTPPPPPVIHYSRANTRAKTQHTFSFAAVVAEFCGRHAKINTCHLTMICDTGSTNNSAKL